MVAMDELERRIRAANPSPVDRDAPLSERAEQELSVLLTTPRASAVAGRVPRRRPAIIMPTIAAAVAVLLTVGVLNLLAPRPAAASAPPLLEAVPLGEDADTVLGRLSTMARSNNTETSSAAIASETWSAELTPTGTATFVQPRDVVRTRASDLSGSAVTRAGAVRWGIVSGATPPAPGTILERFDYGPGEFPLLFPKAPPDSATELQAYLTQYLGLDASAPTGEVFRAIVDLRNEWELTGPQTAAVLELLRDRPDVAALGTVTDRLGRTGIAVATQTRLDGAFRDLLIFAPGTAQLLSAEDVYLGGIPDLKLESPTVMNYIAWKDTP
ncbi:MAG: hypothetical protein DI534_09160 [Leifsonia xyli]|nr:MAG: hypothetical protein DI534_09160 [Leifsonia xyli]